MTYLYWNPLNRKVSLHMKRINDPSPEHPCKTQRLNWLSLKQRPVDLWDHKTSYFLKSPWKASLKEHFQFLISATGNSPGSLLKLPMGHKCWGPPNWAFAGLQPVLACCTEHKKKCQRCKMHWNWN